MSWYFDGFAIFHEHAVLFPLLLDTFSNTQVRLCHLCARHHLGDEHPRAEYFEEVVFFHAEVVHGVVGQD